MSFSSKQFRQALQDSSKLSERFKKYTENCTHEQVDAMYYMVEEFYKIFNDKEAPILKVNALFGLRLALQTCEYPLIEMTEAFLLPVLQDVALYKADKRTYAKTSQFFKEKGYPGSIPNLQQLSHNYVTIASNLVYLAAAIKENCYFYTDKLTTPSAFKTIANKMNEKKVEIPPQCEGTTWKNKYQKNLLKMSRTPEYEANYLNFFKAKVERYLVEGGKARETLDFRKLLKNGDSWLTSEILGCLNQSLDDDNFQVRRFALGLLNDLFIGGDIEAVMIVNEGQIVEQIVERILEIKGSSDIGRGAQIYPEIAGQLELKKNFYIQFMRCIDTWARLVPTAIYLNQQQESKVSRLLRKLKDRQFIFPANEIYPKFDKQFNQNMKRNEQRNNYIIQTLNEAESQRSKSIASNRLSKYSQKISLIKQMRESTILTLPEIQKLIQDTEAALTSLTQNERDLLKNIKTIKYFSQEFQKKFELIEQSVTESRLECLYLKGLKCLQKIQQIGPHYQDYKIGRIDFKKFSELVANKCDQIDKSNHKVSDILSKLSKSKDLLSKSGLDLSRSVHALKQRESLKVDPILQKSSNLQQMVSHHTKTITNMSNLEEDPISSNKAGSRSSKLASPASKVTSNKEKSNKQQSKLSKEESKQQKIKSSVSSSSSHSKNYQKNYNYDTAKFVQHDDYQIKPAKPKKQSISEEVSRHEDSNQYENRPSAHFNEIKSPSKQREQFSEGSNWTSSQQEKDKPNTGQKSAKDVSSFHQILGSGSKDVNVTNKASSNKREVFSDSEFSKYDSSNQELRDAVEKSQNPDFRMVFKEPQASANSKMSKHTIQSHQHYAAVLESLAPKSIDNDISRFSKDKSASQLPPRSQFDNSSRMDLRMNLTGFSKLRDKTLNENDLEAQKQHSALSKKNKSSAKLSIVSESKSNLDQYQNSKMKMSGSAKMEFSNERQSRQLRQSNSNYKGNSVDHNHSHLKGSKLSPQNSDNPSQIEDHPYDDLQGAAKYVLQKHKRHSQLKQEPSGVSQQKQNSKKHESRVSKKSEHPLKSSARSHHQLKNNEYFHTVHQEQPSKHQPTPSGLENIKQVKIKQIEELEQKINKLKEEQKQLHLVRSEWQSPVRPQTLRTALSPRFRNNLTDYTSSSETFKKRGQQTFQNTIRQRAQVMNFEKTDQFALPEGRLIYKRLYKKDLSQLDKHEKRKILKGKDLVFRNDDIEVGLMVHKDARDLKIIYYVTASRFMKTFLFKVESNPKILVHAIPATLANLEPRKQYRIYLFAEILQFPYKLPVLHFKYHPQLLSLQQNLFQSNEVNYFTSIIPFFFLKFFTMRPVTPNIMGEEWSKGEIVRGEETNYSRRILPKHFYVLQYFPDLVNLQSSQFETVYGMQCEYGSTRFLTRVVIKINHFFYIQGVLTSFRDQSNSEKIMEFAITCMTALLQKNQRQLF